MVVPGWGGTGRLIVLDIVASEAARQPSGGLNFFQRGPRGETRCTSLIVNVHYAGVASGLSFSTTKVLMRIVFLGPFLLPA